MFSSPKNSLSWSTGIGQKSRLEGSFEEPSGSFSVPELVNDETTPYFNSPHLPNNRKTIGHNADNDRLEVLSKEDQDRAKFPAWGPPESVPISLEEIEAIFQRLQKVFFFQTDNVRNMFEYFMTLLDSRASRSGPHLALRSIHGDYIGGQNANFRKWYFAAAMDLEDLPARYEKKHKTHRGSATERFEYSKRQWKAKMARLTPLDQVTHVALFLLVWGEANNVRFMPECICFIFKCCIDFYSSISIHGQYEHPRNNFLDHCITPIYLTLRSQIYTEHSGKLEPVDKDHDTIIGYDDMNQSFWHRSGLQRIITADKTQILELPKEERYKALQDVEWNRTLVKTFRETRTWLHIIVNFNRVVILHLSVFWYYTSFHSYPLYTREYEIMFDNRPPVQIRLSIMAIAGAISTFINLVALFLELRFSPRRWEGSYPFFRRFFGLCILMVLNAGPFVAIKIFALDEYGDSVGISVAASHFVVSVVTVVYLSIAPPLTTFGSKLKNRADYASKTFTASFHQLKGEDRIASIGLWFVIFGSKFIEAYLFLTLPLRHPVRELSHMRTICLGDKWIGHFACRFQPHIVLFLIYILEFVLFFLDTYIWYVIWTTIFSMAKCYYLGTSIWTPWNNSFSRLPKRMYLKLISNMGVQNSDQTYAVSKIWNAIIISMYREHYLSIEQVQRLLYLQTSINGLSADVSEPNFFISQEDKASKSKVLPENSEAFRRISFFAQSLTASLPESRSILSMPTFTVFIPHYSEKIILSLKEIIKEEDRYSRLTLLEYLKHLYSSEWTNFVRDTKMMAEEYECKSASSAVSKNDGEENPYSLIGFKEATPVYIMRTRVWASLRSQTLYRTILGFMNYSKAIKILLDLEMDGTAKSEIFEEDRLRNIHELTFRKFYLTVSMQRYKHFSPEEMEDTEALLRAYPEVQIAYIDEELDGNGTMTYYSCLIDGFCPKNESFERVPKYKVRLSGYPILGDGKSDNQNHGIIFTRGEYIQLIDANQDSYIEECLKIRNILAEFEEQSLVDPYAYELEKSFDKNPVAIVGTREYIFSENTGVLGDIAACKEQTFGTLFARTLAQIGGKLHYGHPDFLNGIFMTTRGGVSKAQRGLHLNEDIYAGMTAIARGGRIKHCEYMQCGKGRDLGFTTISNFITKIGAGMGEQTLSREYFYLGTQLPLDRMLSFYYAHLGFHLNNYFIILSIQIFILIGVNLASLVHGSLICKYHKFQPITDPRMPEECANLIPVINWLEKCILSIILVFFTSLMPLAIYELSERGIYKSITRIGKQILCFSPLFEIFVCKIYSYSLVSDITLGGAQYIATGRGFATRREPFSDLYSRFGNESLSFGTFFFVLVVYFSTSIWKPVFIFFWVTVLGLIISPFIFNPNQFVWNQFFVDYRNFICWLHSGNSNASDKSWFNYTQIGRSRLTGVKSRIHYGEKEVKFTNKVRPSRFNVITTVLTPHMLTALFVMTAYLFANSQTGETNEDPSSALSRIVFVGLFPILFNMIIMFFMFITSPCIGPIMTCFIKPYPSIIAAIVHSLSILAHLMSILMLAFFQNFDFEQTVLGLCLVTILQKIILQLVNTIFLTREYMDGRSNRAWWSGKWLTAGLGWRIFTSSIREYFCKVLESTYFAADFMIGHMIFYAQIPILLIPLSNTFHSMILMWLKPSRQLRQQHFSKIERRREAQTLYTSIALFLVISALLATIIILPFKWIIFARYDIEQCLPIILLDLIQPRNYHDDYGLKKDLVLHN